MKSAKLLSLSMCAVLGAASVAEAKWVAFRMWSEGEPRELIEELATTIKGTFRQALTNCNLRRKV